MPKRSKKTTVVQEPVVHPVGQGQPDPEEPIAKRTRMLLLEENSAELVLLEAHEDQVRDVLELQEESEFPVCEESAVWQDPDMVEKFYDEMNGKQLDTAAVKKARMTEIDFINSMGVWEEVPRPSKDSGIKVVKGRWVDIDKGTYGKPNYRSRYVACEIKKGVKSAFVSEFFAAMPPLSSSKLLCILAVTDRFPDRNGSMYMMRDKVLVFIDVKRAHFVSMAKRDIAVELPPELRKPESDMVGWLWKAMYGTRDAAHCWSEEVVRVFVGILGFVQGRANPCHFYHVGRDIRANVHGDDVQALAAFAQAVWLQEELRKIWMIEEKGILGPPGRTGTVHVIRHLGRTISWTSQGITWETDRKHVDALIEDLDLSNGSSVKTPLVRDKVDEFEGAEELLDADTKWKFQSCTMRIGYTAQDRTDLQRVTRELAKGMQAPCVYHWVMLKRCVRYLKYAPRCVQLFKKQAQVSFIDTYVDSDYAGCIRTRRSTTGMAMMLGENQLRSMCRGQGLPSLAVGESEYYGLVSGAAESLGEQSFAADLGVSLKIKVRMDSTTGMAIGSRVGLGKLKHVDVRFLWVQHKVKDKSIELVKVHTSKNYSDIMTKPVTSELLRQVMLDMGFSFPVREETAWAGDGRKEG